MIHFQACEVITSDSVLLSYFESKDRERNIVFDQEWFYLIGWAFFVINWLIRLIMAIVILSRKRTPTTAIAWLVIVFSVPTLGMILYFLIGENRLGRTRMQRHEEVVEHVHGKIPTRMILSEVSRPDINPEFRPIAILAESLGASAPIGCNDLTLLSEPTEMIDRLEEDIGQAKEHCHLLYYIVNDDDLGRRVVEALLQAVGRGVECRLLIDAVGGKHFIGSRSWKKMQHGGVQLASALPGNALRARVARLDLRNHRKLAIIDANIAYTGSQNLSGPIYPRKKAYGAWVDATVRLVGPAAAHLHTLFIEDWYLETSQLPADSECFTFCNIDIVKGITAQVLPTGPLSRDAPLQKVIIQALHLAEQEAVLTTPYFIPDDAIVAAIRSSAMRGVQIDLVVPKRSDNWIAQAAGRSYYAELLDVGVRIHEHQKGMLHAKTLTVDKNFALIGSANLDIRSFMLNFEVALLIYDNNFSSNLRFLQERYMQAGVLLSNRIWNTRPMKQRIGDNIAKLLSPLL